ncbi:hypothetical protein GWI33_000648 [Rhynchophorus ferrugineus]|uniref:Peptidase A2 domain-containing protein n=1 Tax=Rhynchophorus ferrugineus TaxID=354439 RepID=A0A834HQU1_RHYFE|nr:hypothetical protein GWI33_000648 [Rhynchophorus ferrugineus]
MSASNIRLPAFNPNDPEMWFLQVEWTLKHAGITTSAEKFEIVGAALDPIYTQDVRGLLFNPPPEAEDPFSKLKEPLRECLGLSIQNRTRQLLEREEIGDRTPSQFLRRLQSLAGDAAGHDIIKVIWMNQLDPITRASIAAQQASIKLEDLAKIADNIKDSIGSWRPAGGTAPTNSSESQLAEEFARLRLQIHGLQAKVDEVAEHQRASFRNRASSRSLSRGRSSSRSSSRDRSRIRGCELYDGLCWYHYNYAERARRCRPGCRYEKPKRECGKPAGRSLMAASDGHHIMRRLFVKDRNSNQEFLVDTGADLCVFPRRLVNGHRKKTNYDLTAANGEFLVTNAKEVDNSVEFVRNLRRQFELLRPVEGTRHGDGKIFVFKDLDTATHVFVRHDSPKTPLQMPYDGPYEVISRSEKVFILLMRGKQVPVSIDRLKPAYCINDNLRPRESDLDDDGIVVVATQQNPDPHSPPQLRHSARRVRFPDRYQVGFP